eukprot:9331440-Heterocapsa_arctica.AAC.1
MDVGGLNEKNQNIQCWVCFGRGHMGKHCPSKGKGEGKERTKEATATRARVRTATRARTTGTAFGLLQLRWRALCGRMPRGQMLRRRQEGQGQRLWQRRQRRSCAQCH